MSNYLAYGFLEKPSQGSTNQQEYAVNLESDVSFDDLQTQINDFLLYLSSNAVINRPAIRSIEFQVLEKQQNPNKGDFFYYSQIHFVLVGDAADTPT